MTTIHLTVRGAHVEARLDGPLTSGMVGLPVVISYDSSWDSLTKTLYCRNSMGKIAFDQVYTLANIGSHATVAPEVMQAHRNLYLGIQGHSSNGTLVVPTIWANCGVIQPGAEGSGEESQEATPEVWQQLAYQIGSLEQLDTGNKGNLVAAINELSQEAEVSREALDQEILQLQALCQENRTNLTAATQQLEADIQEVHDQFTNNMSNLSDRITQHRFDAASADAELRAAIQDSKNQLEHKIDALEEEMSRIPEPEPVPEPNVGDIPQVFLEGAIPAGPEETQATMLYVSKTATFSTFLTMTCAQDNSLEQEKKSFQIRMFSDADRTAPLAKAFRDWGYASNSYVLRANFTDHSHARNIVASRLWNEVVSSRDDYASLPAQLRSSPRNGATDGFPVKVYVNGTYQGIYTWNMGAERWNIRDENQGVLRALTNSSTENPETPCNFRTLWSGIHREHWSVEAGSQADLAASLNRLISFLLESDDSQFRSNLGLYLDLHSAMDYYLFQYVICGVDGLGKNLHLLTYNGSKWFCGCGDLDASFLLDPSGANFLSPESRCPRDYQERKSLLWTRLTQVFSQEFQARYHQLRGHVLSFSNMCIHFEQFTDAIGGALYQEDVAAFPSIPQPEDNNIRQIRNAIRDRLTYCDKVIDTLGQPSLYDTADYSLNPLEGITWNQNKYYIKGVLTNSNNNFCTEKFRLQNCMYHMTYSDGEYPILYIWDEEGNYIGQLESQLAYFTGQPNLWYAFRINNYNKTENFDPATVVSILPMNNEDTADKPITLKLADLTYTTDSLAVRANVHEHFNLESATAATIAARIHHADPMITIGNSYVKPTDIDPNKLCVFSFYPLSRQVTFGSRYFSNNLEEAMAYFTEHDTTIRLNY